MRLGGFAVRTGLSVLAGATLISSFSGCFTSRERSGQALYEQHCGNCHGLDGRGLGTLIPPLAGADYLTHQRAAVTSCGVIRSGA